MSTHAVTGATSFTGRFIAQRLIGAGHQVRNLTRAEFARIPVYWPQPCTGSIRSTTPFGSASSAGRSRTPGRLSAAGLLFDAARRAGVRRVVHISVINAARDAPTAYFRAKAVVEEVLARSGLAHAIVRPTVTFGPGDILVNNLAWTLRRLPAFGIPGDGRYPIQPVHVDDVAAVALIAGEMSENVTLDAAGPDIFSFNEFVALVRQAVRQPLNHRPPADGRLAGRRQRHRPRRP